MRNAASTLGVIGGIIAMIVGFFSYGYTEVVDRYGEIEGLARQFSNVELIRAAAVLSPLLAIAGGAMAKARALWGGVLMLLACGLMYVAYGFNVGTMFPIAFTGLGGVLALLAGKPDEPKAHF
ncbi:MAG: hypothetical protein RID15_03750 [Marinovum algicola]|jgi:hypothetical protein|uniref:Uncharacterized protein n=1 Tax=Marinovum algicola TaxID=42444 RepID=A0A975W822_9RHOB|nr:MULTISPECIES: hypothetical protein [Marinovum]AKO96211.1 hypothetical protein MALG_01020 [Marinovum algicola DG 898]MDD9738691.1 hypothetical protein [Marinovum sp. SP66]SEI95730.1 hypothetical protein SAMN04487940_102476 [Marinovum algicola]SLN10370.1 hypothetical protein MAA5396_00037 [Marinovum algicola]